MEVNFAGVAQSVVQLIRNQQVVCSSHITSSKSVAFGDAFFMSSSIIHHFPAVSKPIFHLSQKKKGPPQRSLQDSLLQEAKVLDDGKLLGLATADPEEADDLNHGQDRDANDGGDGNDDGPGQ